MEYLVWAILLFAGAILLAILEIFVPSGGILAVLAVTSLVGSILFAVLTDAVFGMAYSGVLLIVVPVVLWKLARFWPETAVGKMILLDPEGDPALAPDAEREKLKALVGRTGIARSRMMPAGTVEIDGQRFDAISDGMPIDPGTPILVIRVDGINMTVRETTGPAPAVPRGATARQEETVEDPFA